MTKSWRSSISIKRLVQFKVEDFDEMFEQGNESNFKQTQQTQWRNIFAQNNFSDTTFDNDIGLTTFDKIEEGISTTWRDDLKYRSNPVRGGDKLTNDEEANADERSWESKE